MIGVIAKPEQVSAVEEFFELFKTPWEFYRPGRAYDVVIATGGQVPEHAPALLVATSSEPARCDEDWGIRPGQLQGAVALKCEGRSLPIYCGCRTLEHSHGVTCLAAGSEAAGVRIDGPGCMAVRLGYDLFEEVRFLLSTGQPLENAGVPTLDVHIDMLRQWMLDAGIGFVEIPPVPAGHDFFVCLTHDIDFVGIRNHKFDHTMWGFLYRATAGSLRNFLRGKLAFSKLLRNWLAVLSLPLVYLGWCADFWEPFSWYLMVEEGLPATYFLIPFKGRQGEKVAAPHASRRAAGYEVADLNRSTQTLLAQGCELAVHGLDAWHSADKGREEISKIAAIAGKPQMGVRMHWLLRDQNTFQVLEDAGFAYDSTAGYNETIGYRSGTGQVFRPLGVRSLLEIPLHIQDGALFYPQRLDLSEQEAWDRCRQFVQHAHNSGGVLTLLWHDRSHAPERLWGDFYARLVSFLRSENPWFSSAAQLASWFGQRREVVFETVGEANGASRIRISHAGEEITPPLTVRVYRPSGKAAGEAQPNLTRDYVDLAWPGGVSQDLDDLLSAAPGGPPEPSEAQSASQQITF